MPLVLASQSPRRQEILRAAGIPFLVRVANVPEQRARGEGAEGYVLRLARSKATAVEAGPDDWVLGADTTVVVDGDVLEKPRDASDAQAMLRRLAGRSHEVLTGICVRGHGLERIDIARTVVRFGPVSEAEIDAYVATGEPFDKAGAYAIQGRASRWVESVEGCYFNVVGLPVSLVWRHLRELGVGIP